MTTVARPLSLSLSHALARLLLASRGKRSARPALPTGRRGPARADSLAARGGSSRLSRESRGTLDRSPRRDRARGRLASRACRPTWLSTPWGTRVGKMAASGTSAGLLSGLAEAFSALLAVGEGGVACWLPGVAPGRLAGPRCPVLLRGNERARGVRGHGSGRSMGGRKYLREHVHAGYLVVALLPGRPAPSPRLTPRFRAAVVLTAVSTVAREPIRVVLARPVTPPAQARLILLVKRAFPLFQTGALRKFARVREGMINEIGTFGGLPNLIALFRIYFSPRTTFSRVMPEGRWTSAS